MHYRNNTALAIRDYLDASLGSWIRQNSEVRVHKHSTS
ncbi:hypothetical protein RB3972 [Rhodopirellula baltica SH 1]|uniref:Uncharacterized protein n=1 Tax=Rhodopirellula baltica (strain DSM 10527 / NCIMB 13988 / SH1) TaxID=243090 RepID=Q7UTC0_RHOBA|nr:hypothetical protein RB3972 [Rhodopirellula baltica SH 1]